MSDYSAMSFSVVALNTGAGLVYPTTIDAGDVEALVLPAAGHLVLR